MTRPANWWQRWVWQPMAHSKMQAATIFVVIVALGLMYWPQLLGSTAEAFWNWIDPVAGISAFILSLAIFYNQARACWEGSLEKRLTVYYVDSEDEKEVAVVEGAYLAGQSDIRQWAQQLGRQMFGQMEMDMNWDDDDPPKIIREIVCSKARFVKSYSIKLYFDFKKDQENSLRKFTEERSFKHSHVEGDADNLPVHWIRKNEDE